MFWLASGDFRRVCSAKSLSRISVMLFNVLYRAILSGYVRRAVLRRSSSTLRPDHVFRFVGLGSTAAVGATTSCGVGCRESVPAKAVGALPGAEGQTPPC